MKKLLAFACSIVLGIAASSWLAEGHPGISGCKLADQGGVGVDDNCNVTIKYFEKPVGSYRNISINSIVAGTCMSATAVNANETCTIGLILSGVGSILDTQVFVKEVRCIYGKTTWDTGDSLTFCLKEVNGSTGTCVGASTFTISNPTPAAETISMNVNTLTTNTADYGLALSATAKNDSPTDGSEQINMSCQVSYEIP